MKRLATILLGSIMILSLTACGPKTMDMTGDFTITYEGADGYATPILTRTNASATLVSEDDLQEYLEGLGADVIFTDDEIREDGFGLLIDYQLAGDYAGLSNDDVITVNMVPSERMEMADQTLDMIQDAFNLEFVSTSFDITVQDLPAAVELDIASVVNQYTTIGGTAQEPEITVHFPVGTERALANGLILNYYDLDKASLIYGRTELGNFQMQFEYKTPLMEGDTITASFEPLTDKDADTLLKSNCILLPTEIEAPALSTPVTSPDTIPATMQGRLFDAARDYLAAQKDTVGATLQQVRFGHASAQSVIGISYTLPAADGATPVTGVLNMTCSITLDGELAVDTFRLSDTFETDYEWTDLTWDMNQTEKNQNTDASVDASTESTTEATASDAADAADNAATPAA